MRCLEHFRDTCEHSACNVERRDIEQFDRDVRKVVHCARMLRTWQRCLAETSRLANPGTYASTYRRLLLDDLRWLWFYNGRVSLACVRRQATTRMLNRGAMAQSIAAAASSAIEATFAP